MENSEPSLEQIYYVVLPLVRRAGQMLVSYQPELKALPDKERQDRGKEIEQEIFTFLATTLRQLFPGHSIYGENEEGKEKSSWQWVLNPLDGGRYYFRGLGLFTTSMALRNKGEVVLGLVYQPAVGTVFHAIKGSGSFSNRRVIKTSNQKDFVGASIYVDVPVGNKNSLELKVIKLLNEEGAVVRDLGVVSLGLCYLASGVFDVLFTSIDSQSLIKQTAGLIVAREAGAVLSDSEGKALSGVKPDHLLVSVVNLQKKVLAIIAKK